MKIDIFDVEHGQCAVITCPPNGKKIMIDAGHNKGKWWPSIHFFGQPIEQLVISNFDEDHCSDVPSLRRYTQLKSIRWNPSVSSGVLRAIKTAGMGPGVQNLHDFLQFNEFNTGGAGVNVDFGGQVTMSHYWNNYPHMDNANDLSVVTFVHYGTFTMCFPGDVTRRAWLKLLERADFCRDLVRTTVMMAAHHGRDNGRCEELYASGWKPMVHIISDAGIEHATQQTVAWYATRSQGCKVRGSADPRYVMTTRSDGELSINVDPNGSWDIGPAGTTRSALAALATQAPWSARSALLDY